MTKKVIVHNDTQEEVMVADLGIPIPPGETRELHETNVISALFDSDDLKDLINNGKLKLNNGDRDLDIPDALDYLTPATIFDLKNK